MKDARARWIAPFIDGATPLESVIEACALDEVDAIAAIEALVAEGLVALL